MTRDKVRAIWEQELQLDGIGDEDDFFEIGGHSLIMTKIQGRLGAAVGSEIPMDVLFRRSTIKSISEYIDGDVPVHQASTS
jgi:acyl carrier protein